MNIVNLWSYIVDILKQFILLKVLSLCLLYWFGNHFHSYITHRDNVIVSLSMGWFIYIHTHKGNNLAAL